MTINGKNQEEIVIIVHNNSHIDMSEYFDSMPFSFFRSGADLLAVTEDETKIYRFVDFYKYIGDSEILIELIGFEGQDLMEYAVNAPSADWYQPAFNGAITDLPFTPIPIGTILNFGENSAVGGQLLGYSDFDILGNSANLNFSGHSLSTGVGEAENNIPTINNAQNAVVEDTSLIATGILDATDADSDAKLTYNKQSDGQYGQLTINSITGAYSYSLNNTLKAVQTLNVGETITDVIIVSVTDENGVIATSTLTITITGTNDVPSLEVATNEVTEGATTDVTGTLVGADIDHGAILTYSTENNGSYGNLTVNGQTGEYAYSLDNSNIIVQNLAAGEIITDVITVYVTDEHGAQTSSTITITISGYNEAPTLELATGAVIEDTSLTTSGTFIGADIDNGAVLTYGTENNGSYGNLTVNSATGEYIYTLDNTNILVDELDEGDIITDIVTITVTDEYGAQTTSTLTITITGTNDTPTIDTGATTTGAVTEDGTLTATGSLSFSDVDADDHLTYSDTDGSHGSLTFDGSDWTYTLDNSASAIQALDAGDTITDTITITATDDHNASVTQVITITITGTNDTPTIDTGATTTGAVTEDGTLTATGSLSFSDVDADDHLTYSDTDGSYGSLTFNGSDWTYTLDNSASAIQSLDAGDTITDTITITATDDHNASVTQVITITITGTNDTPTIDTGATTTGAVTEDGTLTATGSLSFSDVDADDHLTYSDTDGSHGSLTFNGSDWTYTLDNSSSAIQSLDVGDTITDTITITATDDHNALVTQVITITITGTNDTPTIDTGATTTGAVTEDGTLTATGSLSFSDVDADDHLTYSDTDGSYGSLTFNGSDWTYTLDNSSTAIQSLDAGDTITDTITITATDDHNASVTQVITITITGTNDTPTIDTGATTTGAVTEDGTLTATGSLSFSDVDADDNLTYSDTDGSYGSLTFDGSDWTYTLDNSASAIQSLDAGDTITDTITITATDDHNALVTQVITITITGTNDTPTIDTGATTTGAVTEDGTLTATGSLSFSDVDADDNLTYSDTDGSYGSLTFDGSDWTYTLDNSSTAIQSLDAGDTITDTITITATDDHNALVTQVITITITGTNDTPTIDTGATTTGAVTEDGTLTATGSLSFSDVDADDHLTYSDTDGSYGSLTFDGSDWTYTLDNSSTAIQSLDAGDTITDTITITATDDHNASVTQVITITITGTNDTPTIDTGATTTGAVTEDGTLTATGSLSFSDVDADDNLTYSDTDGSYGSLTFDGSDWTYTLDNSSTAIQSLDAGDTITDTITITATDDHNALVTQVITITITGTNDTPTIDTGATTTGAVTEDGTLTATGSLSFSDVDADDHLTYSDTDGSYGSLTFDGSDWTYTLDNSSTAIQSLDAGDTITDTITITATDDHNASVTQVITITITGTNDTPTIDTGATTTGAVTEDGTLTATGSLSFSDVDADDNLTYSDTDGSYGSLTFNGSDWTYTLDNSSTAIQSLDAGDTITDTITITATDDHNALVTQVITITITGTNDTPTIDTGATTTGAVTEDGTLTATGSLSFSDVDADDNLTYSDTDGSYGSLTFDGSDWTYTLDNSSTAIQSLDAGDTITDTITITATDDHNALVTQVITITITGTNDTPTIDTGATTTGAVTEDGTLTATGSLSFSDVDADDNLTYSDTDGSYGSLTFDGSDWTYTLDNSASAIQSLDAGDTITDTITITATDDHNASVTQVITITITGTNDTPTIDTGATTTGAVTEDGTLTATGSLSFSDVDADDNLTYSDTDGSYGSLTFDGSDWTYTLDNSSTAIQSLDAGDTITDTITITATDDHNALVTQVITITITGTNDTPTIDTGATTTGAVTEDGTLTATGSLSFSDVDADDNLTYSDTDGSYGSLTFDGSDWTYTLDNSSTAIQSLDAGDTITDTITITATDDHNALVTQVITITITGTNDTPTIDTGATTTGAVTEDDTLTATGSLSFSDVDADDHLTYSDTDGSHGSLTFNGSDWTYTLDNSSTAIQSLDAGDTITDTITITATDDHNALVTQVITITITGTNDTPTIDTGATTTGAVTEDDTLTATGSLSFSDVDADDNLTYSDTDGSYGSLTFDGSDWTYTLDNSASAIQSLDAGDTITDTITITATDDHNALVTQVITITITGTNDTPTIDTGATTTGAVTEDGTLTATGSLSFSDVDADDHLTYSDTDGSHGSLTFDGSDWTYTLDNSASAIQALDVGDTITDTITITATDDHNASVTQVITITITGTNDTPTIDTGATTTGAVTEDGTLTATGSLSFSDVDADDHLTYSDTDGSYGSLTFNGSDWTYTLDNSASAIQSLDAGDTITDTITITATDDHNASVTQVITITITGTNDTPTIDTGATTTGAVTEDGTLTATGSLSFSDVDADDHLTYSDTDGSHGSLTFNGSDWTYTLDNSASAIQSLDVGDTITDTITITATDDHNALVTQVITITITGTNDTPTIDTGATTTGAVTEDGTLTATGSLSFSDVDADDHLTYSDTDGSYGSLTFNGSDWTYTLDNSSTAIQSLDAGDTITDTITITATDDHNASVTQVITITITGTNDTPTIDTGATTTGAVTEDGTLTATGSLSFSDVDADDNLTYSDTDGSYGSLTFDGSDWTYTLDNSASAIQSLDAGDTITDTITITATDDHNALVTQVITITITGTNDTPTIDTGATTTGAVTEDGTLTATGSLSFSDVDADDNLTYSDTDGSYGSLTFDGSDWTYTLDNSSTAIQSLDAGDTITDTITITATDDHNASVTQVITITITGTNDTPTIDTGATTTGAVTEDDTLTATGSLSFSDVDADDHLTYSDTDGSHGSLTFNGSDWTYTLDNSSTAIQSLDVGDTITDTITITATDDHNASVTQVITITITGTNDTPTIDTGATTTGAVTEDDTLTATGSLSFSDVDADDHLTYSDTDGSYGSLTFDGSDWTYTLDNSSTAIQSLDAGDTITDTITITATDDHNALVTQVITITITGTNDTPTIDTGATTTGAVTEDGTLTATGSLSFSDVDADDHLTYSDTDGSYGSLTFDGSDWTYTLDNSASAIQALDVGDTITDTITITATDDHNASVTQVITITITGTNDAPYVTSGAVTTSTIAENVASPRTITGALVFDDVDDENNTSNLTYSTVLTSTTATSSTEDYGTFTYNTTTGEWTYILDNPETNAALKGLDYGETATVVYTISAKDAQNVTTTQTVTITITGTNEAPIIDETASNNTIKFATSPTDASSVINTDDTAPESGSIIFMEGGTYPTVVGQIKASDSNITDGDSYTQTLTYEIDSVLQTNPDASTSETTIDATTYTNDYGTLTLNSDGTWSFVANTTSAAFRALDDGEQVVLTFDVSVSDGIDSDITQITVTLEGRPLDLNFVHEYGASDIIEWIEYDYNDDGITTNNATVSNISLLNGYSNWTISQDISTLKVTSNYTIFLSQAGTVSQYWVITSPVQGDGTYYQILITDTGYAFYTGNKNLGANEEIYVPVSLDVTGNGVTLNQEGTYITGSDAVSTGALVNDLMSDGSNTDDAIVDYQTYSTTSTTSASQGTNLSPYQLSNAVIGAKNGGRTYIHVKGSGTTAGVNNVINIATNNAIAVTDPNSYLFMEVYGDNALNTAAGTDTITIGNGSVGTGTLGADITVAGVNKYGADGINDHITFGNWSWGGAHNNINLIGDTYINYTGVSDVDAYLTVGSQTITGGITNFNIIRENVGNVAGNAVGSSSSGITLGDVNVTGGLLNMNIAGGNWGNVGGSQSNGVKLTLGKFTTSNNSVANINIAGDNIGNQTSGNSTTNNTITITDIITQNSSTMNMVVAGDNIGNAYYTSNTNDSLSYIHINNVDVEGTSTLNLDIYGDTAGNVTGDYLYRGVSNQNVVHVNNIDVAAGATLNLNMSSGSQSMTSAEDVGGENYFNTPIYIGINNIAGTANILATATASGDLTNATTNPYGNHGGEFVIGANAASATSSTGTLTNGTVTGNFSLTATLVGGTAKNATFNNSNNYVYSTSQYTLGNLNLSGMTGGFGLNIYGTATILDSSISGYVIVTNSDAATSATAGTITTTNNSQVEIAADAYKMINSTDSMGDLIDLDDGKLAGAGGITVSGDAFIIEGNSTAGGDTISLNNAVSTATNIIYGDAQTAINNSSTGYMQLGNDTINDGVGASTIYGDAKTLQGSGQIRAGSDTIEAGAEADIIYGDFGDVSNFTGTIYLSGDYLRGNAGHDIIYTDFITDDGFTGTFVVGTGVDTVYGGWGDDTIYAGYGTEVIDGRNPAGQSGGEVSGDIVYMQGLASDYAQTINGSTNHTSLQLTGTVNGYAADITLLYIEHIIFEDGMQYDWNGTTWTLA